jgi:hypothetical protein
VLFALIYILVIPKNLVRVFPNFSNYPPLSIDLSALFVKIFSSHANRGLHMLNSAFLRRALAILGIGAIGVAPVASLAFAALFTASIASSTASADIPHIIPPPQPGDPPPEDVEDGNPLEDWHIGDGEEEGDDEDNEDVEDGTGGIGGDMP